MTRVFIFTLVLASLVAAACDKSSTAPSITVSSLVVSPATDLLKIGGTEKFSVTATLSSGAVQGVTPAWTTDNPSVATVDSSGVATGVGAGQATITASYQGKSSSLLIRVVPDYAGRWAGTWAMKSCSVQGGFRADWCNTVQGSFPARLELLQTRDYVSGTWTLQESTGNVQGTVAANGHLNLTGTTLQSGVTVTIGSWDSMTTDNRTMTGSFTLTWTVPNVSGSGQTGVDLQSFTKQ